MSFLCHTCLPIFQDHHELPPDLQQPFKFGYGKFKLHEDPTRLLEAAESGCVLCLRVRNQVGRKWWVRLIDDQKLDLSITKSAFFKLEYAQQPLDHRWQIQVRLTAALAHGKLYKDRTLTLVVFRKADVASSTRQEELGGGTNSASAWANANCWLLQCIQHHSTCGRDVEGSSFRPTRLLYIGDSTKSPVRLCHSEAISGSLRYTSLSHRWGDVKILRLLTSNIHLLEKQVPIESLPKTFVDAIEFTRYIGLDYIWIDSLCIIQDDKDDWAREAARMGDVYRYSWCNIAATGFQDSTKGMLAARDPRVVSPISFKRNLTYKKSGLPFAIQMMPTAGGPVFDPPFKLRSHAQEQMRRQKIFPDGEYICFDENFWERSITHAPLSSRAWVFQERLLSPRTLHFGAEQLLWECREAEACETFVGGLPRNFHGTVTYKSRRAADVLPRVNNSSSLQTALAMWNSILASYTATSLTKQSDRLPALSGVAKDIQRKVNSRYLAGLWEEWLIYQLLWHIERPDAAGIETSGAPSWSWASTAGTVKGSPFVDPSELSGCLVARIDDAQVENSADEMGEVLTGTIHITGMLVHLFPTPKRFDWREYPQKLEDTLTPFVFFWPYGTREYTKYSAEADGKRKGVEIDPEIHLDALPWPEEIYLLPIINHASSVKGLVVAPACAGELGGPWKRRGMFEYESERKGAKSFQQLVQDLGRIDDERKSIYLI